MYLTGKNKKKDQGGPKQKIQLHFIPKKLKKNYYYYLPLLLPPIKYRQNFDIKRA